MKNKAEKRKTPIWLAVLVYTILAIALVAAIVVFGVYRGMNMWAYGELGEGAPDPAIFLKNPAGVEIKYVGTPNVSPDIEGNYILTVSNDGLVRKVMLIVKDTKAPTAKSADLKITIDDVIDPEQALTEVYDATDYTLAWKIRPEFGKAGVYPVEITASDSRGNTGVIPATVTIMGVVDRVQVEAGGEKPTLEDFMVVERDDAEIVTDFKDIDWKKIGENEIEIRFDGQTYVSIVEIVDTTPPLPDLITAATVVDSKVKPQAFILGIEDATAVTAEFVTEPDVSKIGVSPCKLACIDEAGNKTEVEAGIIVADKVIELEAANQTMDEVSIRALLPEEYADYTIDPEASDTSFELTELGAHAIILSKDSSKAIVAIMVRDTVAPTAEGIECPCSTGYFCDPMKFVSNVVDMSKVKAEFVVEPDWNAEGSHEVEITLTDRSGNSTTVPAKAVVAPDTTAPVIYAAIDRDLYVGDAVAYFKEVFAADNADPAPELTVDKSKVDSKTAGTYDVVYTATDAEGNSSSVTVKFSFVEKTVTDEQLQDAVKAVTDKIFTSTMSRAQKALAVFNYCYDNIIYSGSSNKTDLKGEAYKGLTQHIGDCYTFYAATYTLLNEIEGCQVLSVERMNGKTQHFWCMVNLGSGWYHFDTCNVGPQHYKCFMRMNSDLAPLSPQYWVYNEALYPAVETTPFIMS